MSQNLKSDTSFIETRYEIYDRGKAGNEWEFRYDMDNMQAAVDQIAYHKRVGLGHDREWMIVEVKRKIIVE